MDLILTLDTRAENASETQSFEGAAHYRYHLCLVACLQDLLEHSLLLLQLVFVGRHDPKDEYVGCGIFNARSEEKALQARYRYVEYGTYTMSRSSRRSQGWLAGHGMGAERPRRDVCFQPHFPAAVSKFTDIDTGARKFHIQQTEDEMLFDSLHIIASLGGVCRRG